VEIMRLDLTKVKTAAWVELLLELFLLVSNLLSGSARLLHLKLGKVCPGRDTGKTSLASSVT